MLLSVRLRPQGDLDSWQDRAAEALELLRVRPGFVRGWIGRSPDDAGDFLLAAEFDSVGNCRRALSASDVRPILWPLLTDADDGPTTYEILAAGDPTTPVQRLISDLAWDADEVRLGAVPAPQELRE